MTDTVNGGKGGMFDAFRDSMMQALDKGIEMLESEQSKVNKSMFEALTPQQKDTFCQTLNSQGVDVNRISKISGRSKSTVYNHLNNK